MGAQRGLTPVRLDARLDGYLGVRLQGARSIWQLDVDCESSDFNLPHVLLRERGALRAHVSYLGAVCISDKQGLSLDPDRRADIVAFSVFAAYDLLEKWDSDAGANRDEFYNELEGYWLGLPDSLRARSAVEVDGKDRLVSVYVNAKGASAQWYFAERDGKPPFDYELKRLDALRSLYVHLNEPVPPPIYPGKVDAAFVEAILHRLSVEQQELWSRLVGPSKNGRKRVALLISVPRPAGGLSLVGVAFGARGGKVDGASTFTPLTVRRHTPAYMRERGGASLDLLRKHIVIVGCGAVGAVVADALAAAGVGRLTLIDRDDFTEDNVFRHVLEPFWVDVPKVTGLRFTLERHYPGIHVTAIPQWAQKWLRTASFDDVDGVVVALGTPTLERDFNRALRGHNKNFPVLFTWLEALDVGGHSVVVWTEGEGCLDCLYRDENGGAVLHPRTSFLEANQPVSKNITGCSSAFVPFGALQSRRTGLMAAEHMLISLSGAPSPSYRYWVGDGKSAAEEKLRTTPWWANAPSNTFEDAARRVFGLPCRHCRPSS